MAEVMGREEEWGRERAIVDVETVALVAKQ
jgi:hypothetical protein